MNKIKISFLFWLLAVSVVSCYEDKGNYDYQPINEVTISGIAKSYEIGRWDTLKIPVELKNSLNDNTALTYAWYLDQKKIGETRDLKYVVSEKPRKYQARLAVMDPANDSVRFFQDFEVSVYSQYSQGLMVLSEYDDRPEVSFMSTLNNPTHKIRYDVFELENNKKLRGKALAIEQSDGWSYGGTVFIHTSRASHELDPVLFKELNVFDENAYTEPNPVYDMVYCRYENCIPQFGVGIGKDGRLYPKLSRQGRYIAPSLKPIHVSTTGDDMVDYDLSPMALTTRDATLAYDKLSGKFMYFTPSRSIPSHDDNQYDLVQISETYVGIPWLGWGKNMSAGSYNFTSLFYDPVTDRAALARAHTQTGKMKGRDSLVMLTDHHLTADSKMTINSANNWLYYSDGGYRIHMINLSDPDFKFVSQPFDCDLPESCRITMLKVAADNLSLYVGVVSDRAERYCGDLYKINVKDGKIMEYHSRLGGTLVDMIEKTPFDYDIEE